MTRSPSPSSSCIGSLLLVVVTLIAVRFGLPGVWGVLAGFTKVAFAFGGVIFLILFLLLGYFIIKNLRGNRQTEDEKKYSRISRVEMLYRSITERLQKDILLNQTSAEESLQAELLIGEKLKEMKTDLVRLYDFASPKNQKSVESQIRDYRQQLQTTQDSAVKQVIEENLKMLNEKKQRMIAATEEVRQIEGSVDLIYNSLMRVDEQLRFGVAVQSLLPADLYRRFGLAPPSDQLAPLNEKSSEPE